MAHRKDVRNYLSVLVMGGALLGGGMVLSQTSLAQDGRSQTLEGTISDTMCGAKHKGANAKACLNGCISHDGKYALVVGDKVYELEGNKDEIAKLGAEKAKVTGTVTGMKIAVSKIEPAS